MFPSNAVMCREKVSMQGAAENILVMQAVLVKVHRCKNIDLSSCRRSNMSGLIGAHATDNDVRCGYRHDRDDPVKKTVPGLRQAMSITFKLIRALHRRALELTGFWGPLTTRMDLMRSQANGLRIVLCKKNRTSLGGGQPMPDPKYKSN